MSPPAKLQENQQGMHGVYSFENTVEIPLMSVVVRRMFLHLLGSPKNLLFNYPS